MNKAIFFCILFFVVWGNPVYSQPTSEMIDVYQGSSIIFKNLYNLDLNSLYIYKWSLLKSEPDNCLYILKKYNKNVDKKKLLNIFFVRKSEFNDKYKIITLVYEDKVMMIKIKKNKLGLNITINNMYFKEGIYNIDFKKIYDRYKKENIDIEIFPTDEDLDLSEDRIMSISQ